MGRGRDDEGGEPPKLGEVIPLRGRRPSEDKRIDELARGSGQAVEGGSDELVTALLRRAERSLAEQRYRQALADCRSAMTTGRAGPAVYWLAAHACAALGLTDEAADALERAVTLAPTSGELWAALAHARAAQGEREAAIDAASRGLELDPESAEPWAALGEIGESVSGPMDALERAWYYEEALEREADRADWMARRARHMAESGSDRDEALVLAERALALSPHEFGVRLDHACVVAAAEGDRARAIELLSALVPLRRTRPLDDRARLADALFDLHRRDGKAKKGYRLLAEVAELADEPHRWLALSTAALEAGRIEDSLFAAAHALDTAEADPDVVFGVGTAYADLGAWRAAEEVLTRYLVLRPRDSAALLCRGEVRVRRARFKAAFEDFDLAIRGAPDVTARMRALSARADLRLARGDVRGAIADHNARVRIDDDGHWARVQRGELWLAIFETSGDRKALRAARRDFDAASRQGNADAFGFRAVARELGEGDFDASRADLMRAIEAGIGVRNWWIELAVLYAKYGLVDDAKDASKRGAQARWAIELAGEVRRTIRRR